MKLSTKGRYAIKAMYYLGLENGVISLKELSSLTSVTEPYLEKLLGILKKGGLVDTVRGTKGGYRLNKEIVDISIGEIISCAEGDLKIANCTNGKCLHTTCPNKNIFTKIYTEINEVLYNIKLKDMYNE